MGNTSSSIKHENNTLIVNKTDIEILNKNVTDIVVDSIVNAANKCSAGISNTQRIGLDNIQVAGDFVLDGVEQKQSAVLNFECVQVTSIINEIHTDILNTMMNAIKNSSSQDILDQLESNAKATNKTGFASFPISGATKSSSDTKNNYTSVDEKLINVQNVIENHISNSFKAESVNECISTVKNYQDIHKSNIKVDGNMTIKNITQEQSSSMISKCVQNNEIVNRMANKIASDLGITIQDDKQITKKTETKTTSDTTRVSEGPIDAIKNLFTGQSAIITVIVIVLIIIILGIVAFFMI